MNPKDSYITQLKKAHAEHKKWLNQVRLVVSGIVDKTDTIPVDAAQTPFGMWLYAKGLVFTTIRTSEVIAEIEQLYKECYDVYLKIYALLGNKKKGLLSFWVQPAYANSTELKAAQEHYETLVAVADTLSQKLRVLEAQMAATSESQFEPFGNLEEPKEKPEETKTPTKRYCYRGTIIEE